MSRSPIHLHSNCKDNPKGYLRRLRTDDGISQPYYLCTACNILVRLRQEEIR